MKEIWRDDGCISVKEKILPQSVLDWGKVESESELLVPKRPCVSFSTERCTSFNEKGAFVVLDFGKELCGGLRIVTRAAFDGIALFRITLGESLSECYSSIGVKNATNDHSPRDFEAKISNMSDLTFGQSGFRFARIELLSEKAVLLKNIYAVNTLPFFEKEGYIRTSDPELNQIIETAAYTLKLNFQNGYIWDGIKRDRLVWSGDLHQEIISSLYLFGDNPNITNSLSFLREETPAEKWINNIPSYSAWWVINLCDYCTMTGNVQYFAENKDYAQAVLMHFNQCISAAGTMDFEMGDHPMRFFLDWPTQNTDDAAIGTAGILLVAAEKYLAMEENTDCREILKKLERYKSEACTFKQTRAFQILAGRTDDGDASFLENEGARGFSTFMAYYILTADAKAGGKNMLSIIKDYFGAMLSRGATTFWEDFHMDWLEGSGRIDCLPEPGQKDIHGDYGAYCYKGFRHSLCHGWASGVLAFVVEYMLGLRMENGTVLGDLTPHTMGVETMEAKLPVNDGWFVIKIANNQVIQAQFKN